MVHVLHVINNTLCATYAWVQILALSPLLQVGKVCK